MTFQYRRTIAKNAINNQPELRQNDSFAAAPVSLGMNFCEGEFTAI